MNRLGGSWPFYLAFKQLFPTGKKGSFFAWLATLGVMLGVMVLIIVQAVMGGFGQEILRLVVETGGDIRVEASGLPIEAEKTLQALLEETPGATAVAPYAQGVVMLQYLNRPAFPYIKGIDLPRERALVPLEDYCIAGSIDNLDEDGVLVSSQLAASLGLGVGSKVFVYSPLILEKLGEDELLLPKELIVVGIFETGWNPIDAKTIMVDLSTMQSLYGLNHAVHGFSLRLGPAQSEKKALEWLAANLPLPLRAHTILDANHDLLFILRLEKTVLFFIILFVILVAAFSIASSLMTAVVRKTREIGLLMALGARPGQVASCFCIQGFLIGSLGTFLGTAGAFLALAFRNDIVHAFAKLTHSEDALLRFYQFANIPVHYAKEDFLLIIPLSILIATLAGLLPAWKAACLKPAEALRAEA